MFTITSLLKQIARSAAIQLGVQAVIETAWPKVKVATSRLLDKIAEQKNKQELQNLADASSDPDSEPPSSPST